MVLAVACTRPNPEYCADTSECTNGLVCDQSTNRCIEAPVDAAQPDGDGRRCDPTAPFQQPIPFTDLNSSSDDANLTMTSDELTAVVDRVDFAYATRASASAPFVIAQEPTPLTPLMAVNGFEDNPSLNADGLEFYFIRTVTMPEPATYGMYLARRATRTSSFDNGSAVYVGGIALKGVLPQISSDGFTLYWKDPPTQQLYSASRGSSSSNFDTKRLAATMNLTTFAVSADELTLFYGKTETPQDVDLDIYVATRPTLLVPFDPGTKLTVVNSGARDSPAAISDDGCVLYFSSNRDGNYDMWTATRDP